LAAEAREALRRIQEAAESAECYQRQAREHSQAAQEARRRAEAGPMARFSLGIAAVGALAAAATALVAYKQLDKLIVDGRQRFTYEVYSDLNTALRTFLASEPAAEAFLLEEGAGIDDPATVNPEAASSLLDLFNSYFIAHVARETDPDIIDSERFSGLTDFVCNSLKGQGYTGAFSYLDQLTEPSSGQERMSDERAAFEEFRACENGG